MSILNVVISIKWLIVKYTTADSDCFLFSLSSYVKTKLWDYTRRMWKSSEACFPTVKVVVVGLGDWILTHQSQRIGNKIIFPP